MMAKAYSTPTQRQAPLYRRNASMQYPTQRGPTSASFGSRSFKTVAFTGHRPEKLPWGTNDNSPEGALFKFRLRERSEERG
jgi:hypothetical protein